MPISVEDFKRAFALTDTADQDYVNAVEAISRHLKVLEALAESDPVADLATELSAARALAAKVKDVDDKIAQSHLVTLAEAIARVQGWIDGKVPTKGSDPDADVAHKIEITLVSGKPILVYEAGAKVQARVRVLDKQGRPVTTLSHDVTLASTATLGDGSLTTLPKAGFTAGVFAPVPLVFSAEKSGATITAKLDSVSSTSPPFAVMARLPAKRKGTSEPVVNHNTVVDKTERARKVLLEPPENPGSEALARLRATRPTSGLNTAPKSNETAKKLGASFQGDKGTNCLCCTTGAICGKTTTELVHGLMRKKLRADAKKEVEKRWRENAKKENGSLEDTEIDELWGVFASGQASKVDELTEAVLDEWVELYGTMQDHSIWWRLESIENMRTHERDIDPEKLGDSQLSGTRDLLVEEARRRNETSEVKYKVIQDGIADTDPLKSKTYSLTNGELFQQMGKYPDGTQYQVFVYGPSMQHWLYGEKYNGKVVLEDYQKAVKGISKTPDSPPTGYTGGDTPHHPVEKDAPDVFAQAYFLAITPVSFDSSQAWKGNEEWPQIQM